MNRPIFIALEGMDGTGKSTLARALAESLDATLLRTPAEALVTVRPVIDAAVAPSAVATQLFYASTVALASEEAGAILATGRSVIVDRYWASTVAYAACRASQVDLGSVGRALLEPDLTVYLSVDEAVRTRRLAQRGMSLADRDSIVQRTVLRAAYERALESFPGRRLVRLDASDRSPARLVSDVCGFVASLSREAA